ncbi:hypothetical protein GCM10009641_19380 [Mycobacterium cookii]|uniref:Uncharacterized protein n=1 Tax=Mycobacterium cookii TaxID=1775 RepID=A0A7I7L048_9MYCO|nr:hypothetical protein MCOO_37550 [Mycobacterium cookii]
MPAWRFSRLFEPLMVFQPVTHISPATMRVPQDPLTSRAIRPALHDAGTARPAEEQGNWAGAAVCEEETGD